MTTTRALLPVVVKQGYTLKQMTEVVLPVRALSGDSKILVQCSGRTDS
jgi:hypothetical protein